MEGSVAARSLVLVLALWVVPLLLNLPGENWAVGSWGVGRGLKGWDRKLWSWGLGELVVLVLVFLRPKRGARVVMRLEGGFVRDLGLGALEERSRYQWVGMAALRAPDLVLLLLHPQ